MEGFKSSLFLHVHIYTHHICNAILQEMKHRQITEWQYKTGLV